MAQKLSKEFIAHKRQAHGRYQEERQTLSAHLSEVGALAANFASKIGLKDSGRLLGLLHDFGKYSQQFQNYIASAVGDLDVDDTDFVDATRLKGKIDHSSAGAQFIWQAFRSYGQSGQGELVGQILALCIASHHSGLIDCFDKNNEPKFITRMAKQDQLTHLAECKISADDHVLSAINVLVNGDACAQAFRTIIAVAQGSLPFSKIAWFNLGFLTRFLFSALIDADRINSAEFENPARKTQRLGKQEAFSWQKAAERVETFIKGLNTRHRIDELRRSISDNCLAKSRQAQGIYTLTVPTGGGKTFASLRYAVHHAAEHDLDRVIYIVPYTSIIEQNATEIRKVLEREGDAYPWVLEHHSNLEPEQQTWKSKLASENWDSPIVLTTMVQFLEACFAGGTRSVRRLHQLANSVVIFDEIQTLPISCTHLFCNALNFLVAHCGTTAVLCTATQPLLSKLPVSEKGQLTIPKENEIVTDVHELFDALNRVDVVSKLKPKGWLDIEIAELAITQFQDKGSCLVVVNTKSWAQQLFQLCIEKVPAEALFHLSTNQCPVHRKLLLDTIRERLGNTQPVLCISTQLIEAGVDVSFVSVIRFLAGLDSIAQAAGRCNRHGEAVGEQGDVARGQVFIVNPERESTGLLKDIEAGKEASQRVLNDGFTNLVAPSAINRYFKYYFYERIGEMSYRLDAGRIGRDDTLLNLLSDNSECPASYANRPGNVLPLLRQSFMEAGKQFNAIDAPTQGVIVPFGQGEKIITELCALDKEFDAGKYYELLRRAQKYSVNVFPNVWKRLIDAEAVNEVQPGYGIYHLDKRFYDINFGLNDTPVNLMENYNL